MYKYSEYSLPVASKSDVAHFQNRVRKGSPTKVEGLDRLIETRRCASQSSSAAGKYGRSGKSVRAIEIDIEGAGTGTASAHDKEWRL